MTGNELTKEEKPKPNRTVETLRSVFQPMTERLTPDVEPAVVYVLATTGEPNEHHQQ